MEHYLRQGFEKWGRVQINDRDKLIIYQRTGNHQEYPTQAPNEGLTTYRGEDFVDAFDQHALADLPLTYPSVDPPISHPLEVNLGDLITLDVEAGTLNAEVGDEEFTLRATDNASRLQVPQRGYERLFVEHVLQADKGLDFDFLVGGSGNAPPSRRPF